MTSFRRAFLVVLRVMGLTVLGVAILGGILAWRLVKHFAAELPPTLNVVTDYRPLRASQIISADGEVIGEFFVEKRVLVPVESIPDMVKHAFIAAEDSRFYSHSGIDYLGIARAAFANLRAGHVVQGGSTITQQMAKMLVVGQERSMARKVKEAILAHRIEKELSKDQILGIYLNHVYLGRGAYGIAAAASAYFGKTVNDLTLAEASMLAGLPKAPGRASPTHDFVRAQTRQHYVLDQMVELGFATREQADTARREPMALVTREHSLANVAAPYFVEKIRRYIADNYGDEELLQRGLRIHTTLNMRWQRAAEASLRRGLEDLQRKLGFHGPIGHLDPEQRRALAKGLPRVLGPAGFDVDDESSQHMLTTDPAHAVMLDATRPGAQVPEPKARLAIDQAAAERRAAGKKSKTEPPPAIDPDMTYAAVLTSVGKKLTVASGTLATHLDPVDEARLTSWGAKKGNQLRVGDVIAVRFVAPTDARGKPGPMVAKLAEKPEVQAALVAVDPKNGHLVSMVGGYDYAKSQFDRAWQAHRQIGSAIKPFVYAAAIESGMNELTIKWDAPVKFKTASGIWAPHNYKPEYLGPLTLRTAIAKSINTISAQLVAQVGPSAIIDIMRRLGVKSPLPQQISLGVGTADLSLEEVAYGIASFPAGGELVSEVTITRLLDADGKVLEDHTHPGPREQRMSPEVAYIVADMMKGVVEIGTGKKARELGRPVAGKTGTSTNYRDAWFVAYTPDLLCGVWVGRDNFKPIGHDATGGQVALPIWLGFMREATAGMPVRDFTPPPGILFARADPDKGVPATPDKEGSRLTPFRRGTLPPQFRGGGQTAHFTDAQF